MRLKVIGFLLVLSALLLIIVPRLMSAGTITVCASGCNYTNDQLQTALDAAVPGDQVLVESGHTYTAPSTGYVLGAQCHTAKAWDCITLRTGVGAPIPRIRPEFICGDAA